MTLKLLGINGSLRNDSYGSRALSILLEAAREFGAETRLLDLRTAGLPMYNPDAEDANPLVAAVLKDVTWADAFVLASPDYHGTMSGAMKNFLDYHWSEFSGKLFAYLCASHEKGLTVMAEMRMAVWQCYGWSLPYGVSIDGKEDFDLDGTIKNPRLAARLRMTARDAITYGSLIRAQFLDDIVMKTPETFAARYGSA
jgi:FMN reductase